MARRIAPILCTLLLAPSGAATLHGQSSAFSCSDTVRTVLGEFAGRWQVDALFRSGPGTWDTTTAEATIAGDLGGCVLREDYRGTRYGERYEYLALWGANGPEGSRVQRFFVHSLHGIFGVVSGRFVGDTLIMEERLTVRGSPLLQQVRYSRPDANGFRQLSRRSTDDGVTWTVTLQARYRRAAPD